MNRQNTVHCTTVQVYNCTLYNKLYIVQQTVHVKKRKEKPQALEEGEDQNLDFV